MSLPTEHGQLPALTMVTDPDRRNTAPQALDFSTCEAEPIRFPGAVQPHGALLVLDPSGDCIEAASDSCLAVLGLDAAGLLGQAASTVFEAGILARVVASASASQAPPFPLRLNGVAASVRASRNEQAQVLIDIEPDADARLSTHGQSWQRREDVKGLRRLVTVAAIAERATELVREWTGFDRVMVYRFDQDWNGEVIAESRQDGIAPYLGLHYPAGDIPRQARELFKLGRVRLIADAAYTPSALLARGDAQAIDLGKSVLRSVSPMHLDYMKNMGVRASLVGSLVVEDRLWGLLACHHLSGPRHYPPAERDAIGWFCEDLSAHLGETLLRTRQRLADDLLLRRRALMEKIRRVDFRSLIRTDATTELLDVVAADGFALVSGSGMQVTGCTPTADRIRILLERRKCIEGDAAVYSTHALASDLDIDPADDRIAGALFVSLRHKSGSTLIWFRRERHHSVRWAGDPDHAYGVDAAGHVSPRKSFALFLDTVRGQSLPWSDEERSSASDLGSLIEIEALRQSEAFVRTVLDSSPEHICILDRHGVIVAINGAWERFGIANGANASAFCPIGISYRRVCSAAYGSDATEAPAAWLGIKAVIDGERDYFTLDYPCHSPTERRWFQMSVYPMRAPCEGVVVAHQNITERILSARALSASEQRYLALLEDQTEVICRFRADGTILYINDAFVRLFGKHRQLLIGKQWMPVDACDELAFVDAALLEISTQQPIVSIERRVTAAGRKVRWMQFVNRGFFDETGHLVEVQSVGRDITQRKAVEEQLLQENEKNRALLRNASDAITIMNAEGYLLDYSDIFCVMLGYTREELRGMHVRSWDCGFTTERDLMAALRRQFDRPSQTLFQTRHRRKDGTVFEVEISGYPVEIGGVAMLFNVSRDISARQRIEAERSAALAVLRNIANRVPGVVYQYRLRPDGTSAFPFASDAIRSMYRVTPEDVQDDASPVFDLLHPEDRAMVFESLRQSARQLLPWRQEYRVRFDDGTIRWLFGDALPQAEADGAVLWHGFITDITERKRAEQGIKDLAFFDPLTRLPNRSLLEDRLDHAIASSVRYGKCAAVAVLDLDNFKTLNDLHGHAAGDVLLMEVAQRLRSRIRDIDTAGRLGGDEFVIILSALEPSLTESLKLVEEVLERTRHRLADLYRLQVLSPEGLPVILEHRCTVSIGFVVFRGNQVSRSALLAQADRTMYRAKALGRHAVIGALAIGNELPPEDRSA